MKHFLTKREYAYKFLASFFFFILAEAILTPQRIKGAADVVWHQIFRQNKQVSKKVAKWLICDQQK